VAGEVSRLVYGEDGLIFKEDVEVPVHRGLPQLRWGVGDAVARLEMI
jgi:hypothetical protein